MPGYKRFLRSCRRIMVLSALLQCAVTVLIAAGAVGLGGIVLGPMVRYLLVPVCAAVVVHYAWPLLRMRGDTLACVVDKAFPHLRNGSINSVQLAREYSAPFTPFSRPLISAAIAQAEETMAQVRLWDLFQRKTLVKSALLFASIIAVYVGLYGKLTAALGPSSRGVEGSPLVGDISLTYKYPKYTGLPPVTVLHSTGDVEALKGTEVDVEAQSSNPAKDARIVFEKSREIPLQTSSDGRLSGSFIVVEDDAYRFSLVGSIGRKGRRVDDPISHTVRLQEDRPPRVDVLSPKDEVVVKEGDQVQIVFRIQDDFGLGPVSLVVREDEANSASNQENKIDIASPPEGSRDYEGTYMWMPTESALIRPGKKIAYAVEALDNDTISGPKAGRSPFFTLEVFSPRKRHDEIMAHARDIFESFVSTLGEDLLFRPDNYRKERQLLEVEKREGRMTSLINSLGVLTGEVNDDPYADEVFRHILSRIKRGLTDVSAGRAEGLKKMRASGSARGVLDVLQRKVVKELEDDAIALDDLLRRQDLADTMDRTRGLLSHDELMSLLENLKQGKWDAKALAEALSRAMEDLKTLYEKLSTMSSDVPDEYLNPEAMKDLHTADLLSELEKVKDELAKGNIDSAMRAAQAYLDSLHQLVASLENMVEGSYSSEHSESLAQIDGAVREIDDLTQQQKGLADETMKAAKDLREAALSRRHMDLDSFLKQEKVKVSRLKGLLTPFRPFVQGALSDVEGCDSALTQKDIPEAYQHSMKSLGTLKALENARIPGFGGVDGKDRIGNARALNEETVDDFKGILYPPSGLRGPGGEGKLSSLAKHQGVLKNKVGDLHGKLSSPGSEASSLADGLPEKIGEAGQAMGESEESLKAHDPFAARPHEERAIQKLGEAKETLEKLRQEMSLKAGSSSRVSLMNRFQGINGAHSGKVEIPGRDAYKVPKEYREEILKAMDDGLPEKYRDLNRSYFERLIK